ncbi:hypothetical protein OAD61_00600 [bacterium]|nr:hypothetical protein [bacterium]
MFDLPKKAEITSDASHVQNVYGMLRAKRVLRAQISANGPKIIKAMMSATKAVIPRDFIVYFPSCSSYSIILY